MRGWSSSATPPGRRREREKAIEEKEENRERGWGTRTLTVNYLENMAIRAAMSVSVRLSVIWSFGTCCRIHSADKLKASQLLSAQLCPLPNHSTLFDYSPWRKFLSCCLESCLPKHRQMCSHAGRSLQKYSLQSFILTFLQKMGFCWDLFISDSASAASFRQDNTFYIFTPANMTWNMTAGFYGFTNGI